MTRFSALLFSRWTIVFLLTRFSVKGFQISSARFHGQRVIALEDSFSKRKYGRSLVLGSSAKNELLRNPQIRSHEHPKVGTKITKEAKAGTLNLIKAMVGTGILALPKGVAATSDFKASIFPAIATMSTLGAISTYTFMLYGRLIHDSQAKTLGELWETSIDKNSAWIVSAVSLIFCFGACLSYSLCLGDVSSSLAQTIGWSGIFASRQFWIMMLTSTVLYPICNLRSLIALAPLSLAGITAVLITATFIGWRCPMLNLNSPYSIQTCGQLLATLSPQQVPKFQTTHKGFLNPSSLILFGMAASAYLGHFSVADLYHSLGGEEKKSGEQDANVGDCDDGKHGREAVPADRHDTMNSFFMVSFVGFLTVTMINCLVMTFGFLTFGGNSMGVILNNFSTVDMGATICRLLTAVSILGGYPFLISACRGEILELWKLRTNHTPGEKDKKMITALLLASLTLASMIISDAGLIIGLAGAVMGSALVYVFPSLLFLATTNKTKRPKSKSVVLERMFCRFLVGFGTFAAVAGSFSILGGLVK